MYFTQEDYKKIENWLKRNSVKDSEFQEALPFTGKETISIVQDGYNRRVNVKDFAEQLLNVGVDDFLNVTNNYDAPNITLKEAVRLIPDRARKEGQVITFLNKEGNWEIYQFRGKENQWNNTSLWENPFDWEKLIIDSILPDEEDLTKSAPDAKGNSYLSLKDRQYEPDKYSGLGRKILRRRVVEIEDPIYGIQEKNLLLQADFSEENTIYEIRYDFDFKNNTINIPKGCILSYQGGSLSNGTIAYNSTLIEGNEVIKNISIEGEYNYIGETRDSIYNPTIHSGLGRKFLQKNIINGVNVLTQDMLQYTNTVYIVKYDFSLNGETIILPINSYIEYEGGSISNGNIIEQEGGLSQILLGKNCINGVNILTQDMISKSNSIYEIKYDFDLNGKNILIPYNSILKFNGGTLKNGTIIGQNTKIDANIIKIFDVTTEIQGTWKIKFAHPEWFGAIGDGVADDTEAIQKVVSSFNTICFANGTTYATSDVVNLKSGNELIGMSGSKIKCNFGISPSHYTLYYVFLAKDVNDITIDGLSFESDLCGIALFGCNDFVLKNLKFKTIKFSILLGATGVNLCENFIIDNIIFDNPIAAVGNNSDGIHMDGGVRNGHVSNVIGHTGDDFLAFNVCENEYAEYGPVPTGRSWYTIENIIFENIITKYNGLSSLSVRLYGTSNCYIKDITIRDSVISAYNTCIFATIGNTKFETLGTHIENFLVENSRIELVPNSITNGKVISLADCQSSTQIVFRNCDFNYGAKIVSVGEDYNSYKSCNEFFRFVNIDLNEFVVENARFTYDGATLEQSSMTKGEVDLIYVDTNANSSKIRKIILKDVYEAESPLLHNWIKWSFSYVPLGSGMDNYQFDEIVLDNVNLHYTLGLITPTSEAAHYKNSYIKKFVVKNMDLQNNRGLYNWGHILGIHNFKINHFIADNVKLGSGNSSTLARLGSGTEVVELYNIDNVEAGSPPIKIRTLADGEVIKVISDNSITDRFADFDTAGDKSKVRIVRGVIHNGMPNVAVAGDSFINSTDNKVKIYSGNSWVDIS